MSAQAPPPARAPRAKPYPPAQGKPGRVAYRAEARPGMGAIPHQNGVAFRVWAPNAEAVSVVGTFNNWDKAAHPLTRENDDGYWYADVPGAKVGDEYRFSLKTPAGELSRI